MLLNALSANAYSLPCDDPPELRRPAPGFLEPRDAVPPLLPAAALFADVPDEPALVLELERLELDRVELDLLPPVLPRLLVELADELPAGRPPPREACPPLRPASARLADVLDAVDFPPELLRLAVDLLELELVLALDLPAPGLLVPREASPPLRPASALFMDVLDEPRPDDFAPIPREPVLSP